MTAAPQRQPLGHQASRELRLDLHLDSGNCPGPRRRGRFLALEVGLWQAQASACVPAGGRILQIPQVRAEDAGRYSCKASNEVGEDWLHYELLVLSECPGGPQAQLRASLCRARVGRELPGGAQSQVHPPSCGLPPLCSQLP